MPAPRRRRADRLAQYESEAYRTLIARFTANLRGLREERGWTQEEAGANCGMVMQQYQRIETGKVNATFTTLVRVAEGFGVDITVLLLPLESPPGSEKQGTSTTPPAVLATPALPPIAGPPR